MYFYFGSYNVEEFGYKLYLIILVLIVRCSPWNKKFQVSLVVKEINYLLKKLLIENLFNHHLHLVREHRIRQGTRIGRLWCLGKN